MYFLKCYISVYDFVGSNPTPPGPCHNIFSPSNYICTFFFIFFSSSSPSSSSSSYSLFLFSHSPPSSLMLSLLLLFLLLLLKFCLKNYQGNMTAAFNLFCPFIINNNTKTEHIILFIIFSSNGAVICCVYPLSSPFISTQVTR